MKTHGEAAVVAATNQSRRMLLAPFFMVLISLVAIIITASEVSASTWVSSRTYYLLQTTLQERGYPISQLNNFWELGRSGLFPVIFTSAFWVICVQGIDRILLIPGFDLNGPTAHTELVREGKRWTRADITVTVCLYVVVLLVWCGLVSNGFSSSNNGHGGLGVAILGALFVCFISHSATRSIRIGLLRAEGPAIKEFMRWLKPALFACFFAASLVLGYAFVNLTNNPPFGITVQNDDWEEACNIANNATYVTRFCSFEISRDQPGPLLVCVDGGFKEYASAEYACSARLHFFSASSKQFAALVIWVDVWGALYFRLYNHGGDGASVLPRLKLCANVIVFLVWIISFPLALGVVIGPQPLVRDNYWAQAFFGSRVGLFVIGGYVVGGLLHNVEAILRAFGAGPRTCYPFRAPCHPEPNLLARTVVTGGDMPTQGKDGEKSTVRKELENIMGPSVAAVRASASASDKKDKSLVKQTLAIIQKLGFCPCLGSDTSLPTSMSDLMSRRSEREPEMSAVRQQISGRADKYVSLEPSQLVMGKAKDAALGINHYMQYFGGGASSPAIEPTQHVLRRLII